MLESQTVETNGLPKLPTSSFRDEWEVSPNQARVQKEQKPQKQGVPSIFGFVYPYSQYGEEHGGIKDPRHPLLIYRVGNVDDAVTVQVTFSDPICELAEFPLSSRSVKVHFEVGEACPDGKPVEFRVKPNCIFDKPLIMQAHLKVPVYVERQIDLAHEFTTLVVVNYDLATSSALRDAILKRHRKENALGLESVPNLPQSSYEANEPVRLPSPYRW